MDITYRPMAMGFVYLAAVVDWHTGRVLLWHLSVTIDTHSCIAAVEDAIDKYGKPEIVNTDQGSQFTLVAFTGLVKDNNIKISMGGKDARRDKVLIRHVTNIYTSP